MAYFEATKIKDTAGSLINPATEATLSSIDDKLPALDADDRIPVNTANITTKFRESFEGYTPGVKWTEAKGSGDLIYVDGNAASASYLVISKNPLVTDTDSYVDTIFTFNMPTEISVGLSMSQRTLGQQFSIEVIDTGTALASVSDIAISIITQATTTLTVETVTDHGLSVGKSIGITGCSNVLANYPALVVASVPSPRSFTATAGPGGTIASQTITNPAGAKGSVYFRERMSRTQNGISQVFENPTVTNSSLYARSETGDVLPSGTIAGNHNVTIGTTAPVALVTAAYQYAFTPTTEYRILTQADRIQWADSALDTVAGPTSRLVRTQVIPNPSATYRLRFRAINHKSLTVPNAQIVSAVKSGGTSATITTDAPHGYTTGDVVVVYGIRDQAAASFPNLLTATAVTVTGSNTFTIVIGTAATVTSYGGYVARVQGGNLMSALGGVAQVVQSASLQTLADGTRQLLLIGSATWAGVSIGDLVNVVGMRNAVDGATLGLDGAWKVANLVTTALTLVLPYTGSMSVSADYLPTTIAAGSNGLVLPQATVNVADTTGYPASGTFWVITGLGPFPITYTGLTGTSFTGCSGGAGTMLTGQSVFGVTLCGGAIIKRTDLRISFVRIFDYERQRVELLSRPTGDIAGSVPVTVNNSVAIASLPTLAAVTTVGTVSNQTNMGGQPATEQIPSLMRLGADSMRRNITVS